MCGMIGVTVGETVYKAEFYLEGFLRGSDLWPYEKIINLWRSNMAQWIIPCNPELYDVFGAFKKLKCIDWRQSNHSIAENDDVYIYVGKPIAAIMFKCKVNRANYENGQIDDSEFILNGELHENYGNYMELELLEEYEQSKFPIEVLKANGMRGRIQGPRHVNELATLLNSGACN